MRILLIVGAVAALSGCASTLPAPDGVRITSRIADPAKCQYVGEVRGDHNLYGGVMVGLAQQSAESQIMNRAAQMGANTVEVSNSTAGWAGANMSGKAYRCG